MGPIFSIFYQIVGEAINVWSFRHLKTNRLNSIFHFLERNFQYEFVDSTKDWSYFFFNSFFIGQY